MDLAKQSARDPLIRTEELRWDTYYPKLLHVLRGADRSGWAAEDALQLLWLDTSRRPPPADVLRNAARLFAWLLVAARRRLVDVARRERRHQHFAIPTTLPTEPAETADRDTRAEQVRHTLGHLIKAGRIREAHLLSMRFLEERSVRDIANILNVPPRAVSARLLRAKREFRLQWKQGAQKDRTSTE